MSYATFNQLAVTGVVNTLTGNAGGAVGPDASNDIDIVGSGALTVTGTPVTNTLTISIASPIDVPQGGTGLGTILDHSLVVGSGTAALTALGVATDGQLVIGSTGADPVIADLTSLGGTVIFTPGPGTLNLEVVAGSGAVTELDGDLGTAVPTAGAITISGGANISTSGALSDISVDLDAALTGISSIEMTTAGSIATTTSVGETYLLQAYDTLGTAYTTFATLTAGNPPTMDLDDAVTKSGNYIYRAGGTDVPVADGGTGASTLTSHGVLLGNGTGAITALAEATDGQLVIGSTGNNPVLAVLTSTGGSVSITNGAGSINLEVGSGALNTLNGDSGSATPTAGAITIAGGANITTSGAGSTLTAALDAALSAINSIDLSAGGRFGTATSAGNTVLLQAYDTLGAAYTTFATLTAGNPPTMNLADNVTKNGEYIYRAGGTDVPVADGGTGSSSLTDHGVLVGSGTNSVTALSVGTDGQVLLGSTGADPVFATLASSGSTISFTPGAGTLNLETGSAVARSFPTGSGTATPSSGSLTIAGGDNISTSGSGSTVTIAVGSAVCDSFATDSGTATPSAGVITIAGGGDVSTSGSGSTVTVTYSGGGGGGITWNEVTGTTQAISVNNGYIANNGSLVTLTLPATAAVGDVTRVIGLGAGGWKIAQNASQYISWDESTVTTTGATGYLSSSDDHDAVELICTVTNNGWGVLSSKGNITIA